VAEERIMVFLFQLENLAGVSEAIDWTPRADELLWTYEAAPVD
jgi:peptide/nickel transport system substrate-binding protein